MLQNWRFNHVDPSRISITTKFRESQNQNDHAFRLRNQKLVSKQLKHCAQPKVKKISDLSLSLVVVCKMPKARPNTIFSFLS